MPEEPIDFLLLEMDSSAVVHNALALPPTRPSPSLSGRRMCSVWTEEHTLPKTSRGRALSPHTSPRKVLLALGPWAPSRWPWLSPPDSELDRPDHVQLFLIRC